jgi:hypothetical protein
MAEVFISYAHPDRELAAALAGRLAGRGYTVWWDHELVGGAEFRDVIVKELRQAHHALVIWSPNSIASKWVIDEAEVALELGKLVPIKTGSLAATEIPIGFRQLQAINLDSVDAIIRAIRSRIAQKGVIGDRGFLSLTSTLASNVGGLVNRYSYEYGLHIAICFLLVPIVLDLFRRIGERLGVPPRDELSGIGGISGIWGLIAIFLASLGWANLIARISRQRYDHGIFLGLIIISLLSFALDVFLPANAEWDFFRNTYARGLLAYLLSGLALWGLFFGLRVRDVLKRG